MSAADPSIDAFLLELRAHGRSNLEQWHEFYLFLKTKTREGHRVPPVPMILAASGESAASKYNRLSEQLAWARENGCLDEVLDYLNDIPAEGWSTCPPDQWNEEHYPR